MPFDRTNLDAVADLLGEPSTFQARWGADLRTFCDTALSAAEEIQAIENPMRVELRTIIRLLRTRGRTFKIYCHRRARPHFKSLLVPPDDLPLSDCSFLHSVRDYNNTPPFDDLIKIGPFRSRGWSSAPDALLTAPRFSALDQILWSGCSDEPDFGYDPVSPPSASVASPGATGANIQGTVNWITQLTLSGDDPGASDEYSVQEDELRLFRDTPVKADMRAAVLVQIDSEYGILYLRHSEVLSFDPEKAACQPISMRIPGETLLEGMFVISPFLEEGERDGMQAEPGHYSRIWKVRLEQEMRADAAGLVRRLRDAGLHLVNLGDRLWNWIEPPTTVIHAPQRMKHFEILLLVLRVTGDNGDHSRQKGPFWRLAWNEVRRSRGECIQAGFLEHEIVEEKLFAILGKLLPEIRQKSLANTSFRMDIPAGNETTGSFLFSKVQSIEEGFSVPESELKVVFELSRIDQWRD